MGDSRGQARLAATLLSNPKRLLTTVLFGNMVVNVVFFSVSFFLIVEHRHRLGPVLTPLLWVASLLFIILFCELLPKHVALTFARPLSLAFASPLLAIQRGFGPFIALLEKLTDGASALLGVPRHAEPPIRAEELDMLIGLSLEEGILDMRTARMLLGAVTLSARPLRQVMIPLAKVVTFDVAGSKESLASLFRETKQTHIPIYEGRPANMLGIVHAEDFLFFDPKAELRKCVRPVPVLPETASAEEALQNFRAQRAATGFVVNAHGSVVGMVTLEDILEEIVGEIADEHELKPGH